MVIRSQSYHAPLIEYRGSLPIVARFDRSLHLVGPDGHIVTISREGTNGPLTCCVPSASWPCLDSAHGVRFEHAECPRGLPARERATIVILLGKSAAWEPAGRSAPWHAETLAASLRILEAATVGSAFFQAGATGTALMSARTSALDAIGNVEPDRFADAASRLAGMGPGLTPSGADWLVGLTISLTRLSLSGALAERVQPALAAMLTPRVLASTTRLSRTFLWFAAQGVANTDLLDLARALALGGQGLEERVGRVTAIGDTSGADTALGLADGIRLVVASSVQA
jgi:Protein of unknown function (DUF2877)